MRVSAAVLRTIKPPRSGGVAKQAVSGSLFKHKLVKAVTSTPRELLSIDDRSSHYLTSLSKLSKIVAADRGLENLFLKQPRFLTEIFEESDHKERDQTIRDLVYKPETQSSDDEMSSSESMEFDNDSYPVRFSYLAELNEVD